jgi:hypothetical protein
MATRSWLRRLFAPTTRTVRHGGLTTRRSPTPPRCRPRLEALEDRLAPAILTVTTLSDAASHIGTSLRDALAAAAAGDTVQFQAGLSGAIDLSTSEKGQGTLTLSKNVTIDGTGASVTVEGGSTAFSVSHALSNAQPFVVNSGVTAALKNLTISNGLSPSDTEDGGGILNVGTLTVSNCTLSGNSAGTAGGGIFNTGTMTVSDCTLSQNQSSNGGGIANTGTMTVTNCTLSENHAVFHTSFGGGILNSGTMTVTGSTLSGNSANFEGGGISNFATLTVAGSTLSGNSAGRGGGIHNDGTLTVVGSTLSGNSANFGGVGGGIYNDSHGNGGTLTLNNSIVANSTSGGDISNSATLTGSHNLIGDGSGGLSDTITGDPKLGPLANNGGPTQTMALLPGSPAIDAGDNSLVPAGVTTDQRGFARIAGGTVDIGAYEVQANPFLVTTAADPGGLPGLLSLREAVNLANAYAGAGDPAAISFAAGVSAVTLSKGQLELSGHNATTATITIDGSTAGVTVDGNNASRVFQVDSGVQAALTNLTIRNGSTTSVQGGGGIFNVGTLTVSYCTLSGNSGFNGGGIANGGTLTVSNSTLSGNSAEAGGGINNGGTLRVSNCTLSGNSAADNGGGIYNDFGGTLTVSNSTLSGNSAGDGGGGIYNGGTLTVSNSTLSGNSAGIFGGGIFNGGTLTINNTIVANSGTGGDLFNFKGGTMGGSDNLVDDGSGAGLAGTIDKPALLGTLGDYGGPTPTLPLLPGSPAIDAGSNALIPADPATGKPYTTDQRGQPRLANGAVDVGAFESQGFTLAIVSGSPQSATVSTAFAAPLVVRVMANHAGDPVDGGQVTFTAPASGAGATLSPAGPVTIAAGQASVAATANATVGGPYQVNASANGASAGAAFQLTNASAAPTLVGTPQIDDGTGQRSMVRSVTLRFNRALSAQDVQAVLGQLSLSRQAGLGGLTLSLTGTLDASGTALTLHFAGTSVAGGSLEDGRYTLRYGGSVVLDPSHLFRLFGDVNGDGQVDASDQSAFLAAYRSRNGMANYHSYFDYNGDGMVDSTDYYQFLAHLNHKLDASGNVVPL